MPISDRHEDFAVTRTMIHYGGSFARTLGELYSLADPDNQRRLRGAFPELFAEYVAMTDLVLVQRHADASRS